MQREAKAEVYNKKEKKELYEKVRTKLLGVSRGGTKLNLRKMPRYFVRSFSRMGDLF